MDTTTLISTINRHDTGTVSRGRSLALWAFAIAALAAIPLQAATAPAAAYSVIISPDMDTLAIQKAISTSSGAVYFKPGIYYLTGSLPLIGSRTYAGAGSPDPRFGSILIQTAPPDNTGLGTSIFSVVGYVESVTITGLTFDGAPGVGARAIGAVNPVDPQTKQLGCGDYLSTPPQPACALLTGSTISANYFLSGLAEGIDTPMEVNVIERNHFGDSSIIAPGRIEYPHRHIHSVFPDVVSKTDQVAPIHLGEGSTTAIRIVNNSFRNARGALVTASTGESIYFESGAQLQIIDNQFENNDADTTLRIKGMFEILLKSNHFDGNNGQYIMHFARARQKVSLSGNPTAGDYTTGNYIVRSENNFYDMQHNQFIFTIDKNLDDQRKTGTHVYMGNESGMHFTHSDGTAVDLTDPDIARQYNPMTRLSIDLSITGPFNIPDYSAKNPNGCGPTEITLCQ